MAILQLATALTKTVDTNSGPDYLTPLAGVLKCLALQPSREGQSIKTVGTADTVRAKLARAGWRPYKSFDVYTVYTNRGEMPIRVDAGDDPKITQYSP